MSEDDDFLAAAGLVGVGMLVPVLVVAVSHDLLSLYLPVEAFVAVVGVCFTLVAWTALDLADLDRVSLIAAAIVLPALSIFLVPTVVIIGGVDADFRRYLFWDFPGLFTYGGTFTLAALAGATLSSRLERLRASENPPEWLPARRRAIALVWGVLLVGVVLLGGANHVAASSARVATLEPGVTEHRYPALEATIDGGPAELRVTAEAPDGTQVTRRLSRDAFEGGTATLSVRVEPDGSVSRGRLPVTTGTYRVEVETLSGVTVDVATFTVDDEPMTTIASVTTGNDPDDFEDPAFGELDRLPERPIAVGVVVTQSDGTFGTRSTVWLRAGDDSIARGSLYLSPGERGGVVFPIRASVLETLHERHDGVVTVELKRDDETVASEAVVLPERE